MKTIREAFSLPPPPAKPVTFSGIGVGVPFRWVILDDDNEPGLICTKIALGVDDTPERCFMFGARPEHAAWIMLEGDRAGVVFQADPDVIVHPL